MGAREDQIERLQRLRAAFSIATQTDMARLLNIKVSRWNNFERGMPLSKDVIIILCNKFGVTSDWLLFGNPSGLSREIAKRLGEWPIISKPRRNPSSAPKR